MDCRRKEETMGEEIVYYHIQGRSLLVWRTAPPKPAVSVDEEEVCAAKTITKQTPTAQLCERNRGARKTAAFKEASTQ